MRLLTMRGPDTAEREIIRENIISLSSTFEYYIVDWPYYIRMAVTSIKASMLTQLVTYPPGFSQATSPHSFWHLHSTCLETPSSCFLSSKLLWISAPTLMPKVEPIQPHSHNSNVFEAWKHTINKRGLQFQPPLHTNILYRILKIFCRGYWYLEASQVSTTLKNVSHHFSFAYSTI